MDRNAVIGFVLIAAIIIAYTFYSMPSKEQQERAKRTRDSIALVTKQQQIADSVQQASGISMPDTAASAQPGNDIRADAGPLCEDP